MNEETLEDLAARAKAGDRDAVEAIVVAVQDDVYRLAMRMLGLRADAQDATQEILVRAITHLGTFRGESSLRTWVYRIAVRHLLRFRRSKREEVASFDTIEMLIAKGGEAPAMSEGLSEPELRLLAEEVRLSCTQGMLLSIDREHRVSWILAEVFQLSGDDAASVLGIDAAAHRKRLSRARERLGEWMRGHCGLVDTANACRCARQVPVARSFGVASLEDPEYATHPRRSRRSLEIVRQADEIEAAAAALRAHPDYAAPEAILGAIRAMVASGRYMVFDA